LGFQQGFLYFDDRERSDIATVEPGALSPALWMTRFLQRYAVREKHFTIGGWEFRYCWRHADALTASAVAWLERPAREPFLLFMNYMDPHDPYRRHAEYEARWLDAPVPSAVRTLPPTFDPKWRRLMDNYDTEIAYTDEHIGRLLEHLKLQGLFDRSLIIVASDHGEAFGEHGQFGHNNSLHQEEIHVPLIVRYPGGGVSGVNDELISLTDIMPLILNHLGIAMPAAAVASARARACHAVAEMRYGADAPEQANGPVARALFAPDGLKTIAWGSSGGGVVFDLPADPLEMHDLSAIEWEWSAFGASWLNEWAEDAAHRRTTGDGIVDISDDLERQLRSLGYLN
jgi:arylsulfatase A-like enzyme